MVKDLWPGRQGARADRRAQRGFPLPSQVVDPSGNILGGAVNLAGAQQRPEVRDTITRMPQVAAKASELMITKANKAKV